MRIALFSEVYLPQLNGVVTHVKILRDGLTALGHEVLVVTADTEARHHYLEDGVLHCPAIELEKLYGYGLAAPLSSSRLRYIRDFAPDVIHIHTEFGIGLSGVYCARKLGVPLVYTLHTMYDEYIYYIAPKALAPAATRLSHQYTRMLAKRAGAVTGPSAKCREYFRPAGLSDKVRVIPNAAEVDAFLPGRVSAEQKQALRGRLGLREDDLVCCFVGRLGREKSVDLLLDWWHAAIRPEDHMRLLIIGGGPGEPELRTQAQALGLGEGAVVFTGALPHDELPPYYALSDVYITASLSDTNSISMLEGMSAGLPVLQRTDPLNAGQVRDGDNGYTFDSAADMADKLRKIQAMTPEESAAFHRRVSEEMRHSGAVDLASRVLAVYQDIIGRADSEPSDRRLRFHLWKPRSGREG